MLEATGAQGGAIRMLHEMASGSSTFANRAKLYSQAELAGRVYLPWQKADEAKLPCVVIRQIPGLTWYRWTGGAGTFLRPRGTLELKIIDSIVFPDDQDHSEIDFRNFVDGLIEDIANLSGTEWLNITEMRETVPPESTAPNQRTVGGPRPYFHCVYQVDWDSR